MQSEKYNNGIFKIKGEILDYGLLRPCSPRNDEVVKLQVCGIMDCFVALRAPRNDKGIILKVC